MKYKKIRVSSVDAPKRFYRVLYVREDLNLFELGVTILSAFDCFFCHMFMFFDKKYTYIDKLWKDDFSSKFIIDDEFTRERDYEEYKLSDLELRSNNTFKLCYDTGDNWEFEIKIYKAEKDLNEEVFGKLIEGAGASIWEDNHYLFDKFLEGGSDAISDEEKEFLLGMIDVDIETFDDLLDIEYLNENVENADLICEEMLNTRDLCTDI